MKSKKDRSWNKYQSRPKYIAGEPQSHLDVKIRVETLAQKLGYGTFMEWPIKLEHQGRRVPFRIDLALYNAWTGDKILLQFDGGYHRSGKIQIGKTKNRDETQSEFAKYQGIRYITLAVEEVRKAKDSWIISRLNLSNERKEKVKEPEGEEQNEQEPEEI